MNKLYPAVFLALTVSAGAVAQSRQAGDWEVSLLYKSQSEERFGAPTGPDEANVNFGSDNGWGFTVGYNFDEHFNLAWEFSKNTPRYKTRFRDAEGNARTLSHTASFYTNNLNGTYHFLKGPITPFVSAGLGWALIDSNVSDGRGYCVPDYFWGWYCYSSSYDETTFTYSAAVGLRADFGNNIFLRASYGRQWMNEDIGRDEPEFDIGKVEFGFRF